MRCETHNRSGLTRKTAKAFALALVITLAAVEALPQQKQDTKKPTTQTKRKEKKKVGLLSSLKATIDVGGQFRSVKGHKPGKFEENRDVPQGGMLRNFQLDFITPDSPYWLKFRALEVGQDDQRYVAEANRVGVFNSVVLWDQLPKSYSTANTFHLEAAPGVLVVNPNLRAALQAVPDAGVGASVLGPTLPALVRAATQNQAVLNLRVRRDQFLFTQTYRPTKNWEFFLRIQQYRQHGTRPKPTGTFAREATGPAGDGVWEALGAELPEHVEYRTTNLTVGFEYSRPSWRVGVDYNFSNFNNSITSLTWENPFRVTDALAVSPAFGVGRNRFVRAQLALPPDNDYQSVTFHGSIDLPRTTQLRGAVTWGKGTQNEPFLPYTLNSAMVSANLPAGVAPLFNLAPPAPSLNGEVHTLDQDYTAASRPWHNMKFVFQYKSNDVDNQTPMLQFPGLASFGDSGVRTATDFYGLPIENFPTSYTRQNITGSWEWEATKKLDLELEYDWEIWNRRFLEAPRTNEHSIQAKLDYRFKRNVTLKGDYQYAHRIPRTYLTQPLTFVSPLQGSSLGGWVATTATRVIRAVPLEFNLLRRFDDNDRVRNDGGGSVEFTHSDKLTSSISYRYFRDDYDKNFYGLHYDVTSTIAGDVTYFARDNMFFYGDYSRDQQRYGYRDLGHLIIGATQNVTACCAQFPIANTYDRSSKVNLDSFQVGFNTSNDTETSVLNVSYALSFVREITHTVNPFPILPISLRTAGAYNYPDVINREQEVNISFTQRLREGLDLGFNYRYEPYRLDDYYTNNLQPYAGPTLITAGGAARTPVPRYLFLDARFTSYHANVATVFLRYSF